METESQVKGGAKPPTQQTKPAPVPQPPAEVKEKKPEEQPTAEEKEKKPEEPSEHNHDRRFVMVGPTTEKEKPRPLIPLEGEKPRYSGYLTMGVQDHLHKYGGELSMVESGQVPKEMKAIVLKSFGKVENIHVALVPVALPTKGQVLIKSHACGMNYQDVLTRQGFIDHAPKTPFILGGEVAGQIVGLGDNVKDLKVGDRVVALPEFSAWCQYVTCPSSLCFKLPSDMTYQEAVTLATNGITAYSLLFELGSLCPGKSVLIHPASGGLGSMINQMAHTVKNVTLFTNEGRGKEEIQSENENDHYIEHGVDYVSEIRRVSPMGVDLILDSQCGDNFHKDYNLLKPMGKYILYGTHAAAVGENRSFLGTAKSWWGMERISPIKIYEDNKSVGGFNLNKLLYFQRERHYAKKILHNIFKMWFEGKIKAVVDSAFAFEDFTEAIHRCEEHVGLGKIILDPTFELNSEEALEAKANIFERCLECKDHSHDRNE